MESELAVRDRAGAETRAQVLEHGLSVGAPAGMDPVLSRSEPEPDVAVQEEASDASAGLNERLQSEATDSYTAFKNLFGYWQLRYDDLEGATACARAATTGLRCLRGTGNWTKLRHYNRPCVLELVDGEEQTHRVVASALGETDVTLDFGEKRLTLPTSELEPYWFGKFVLLWKPPPRGTRLLRLGSTGSDVLWLRAQLDRVDGGPAVVEGMPGNPMFDEGLRERVKAFQRAHALRPDGIVGEQTLIQLRAAVPDPLIPVLRRTSS
jgi:general secretion pathway protein A